MSDWLQLLDAFNLLAAARDEKVLAVLCGHTHKRSALLLDPRAPDVPFCLCGSTTQYHEPNGNFLNLIDITLDSAEGAPAVSLHSFEYSSFSGQFE